jgi:hypothetical protein
MWDYFSMIFWVIIAVVGLVLYTNPSMLVRHMYEGFDAQPDKAQQQQQQEQQPQPKPQEQAPINVNSMLRNLEQLIGTPGNIPDVSPTMPTAVAEQPHASNTGREQPKETDGESSLHEPVSPGKALEQGKAFQQIKPQALEPQQIIRERIVEVPVPRTCPRQEACPVCPDMQQYIRKDSIPCWACKL